uniref:NADH-ubiquinone oxidoreductase chain 1 n=1 Tax=Halocynthia aurantium TaxID=254849 RepID=A0A7L8Y3P0_HALAU|nr:NADH dehydrogenase subunit 1 [Halocynthia aurantium]QOI13839.1 NADH dehydrogenase subunit 1 [Halocynthia aurantium]
MLCVGLFSCVMYLFSLVFVLFLLLLVAFLVLLERKVFGLTQVRLGPNIVGVSGLVQTIGDGVKLLLKRFFYFSKLNFFFWVCPMVGFILSIVHWLVLPFPGSLWHMGWSVLFTFAVSGVLVYVVLWAGWGSDSVFGLLGSVRGVSQMISYEVVFMFFVMCFLLGFGSYCWEGFVGEQVLFGFFFKFLLVLVWGVILLAELNRTPFDLVEGESELVSGFNVEYAGFGFTLLFLAEYMNIWFISFLTTLFFFGFWDLFWYLLIGVVFVCLCLLVRCVLPRYKFTQLIDLMWKVLLPCIFFFLMCASVLLS